MTQVAAALGPSFPDRSVTGRAWALRPTDDRLAYAIAQRHGVPELVARILAGRGVPLDGVADFLKPRLRTSLPDPSSLVDMDRAVDRLAAAVQANQRIAVFGDYDVDGACSAALLIRYLRMVAGAEPLLHIPDRLTEGYGPNGEAMRALRRDGAEIAVLVDCGTTGFDGVAAANAAGLDVVIVDHHTAETRLPEALAIVNPNRLDDSSGQGALAACGVVFLVLVGLNRALRRAGWFAARPEPDLMALLDLVALGTVCDVVPLTGLNRAFVCQGLGIAASRQTAGLCALADAAGLDRAPDAGHLGFVLGPRINAGGRVGRSDLGARLLATDDRSEAVRLAGLLDDHNEDRKAVEAGVLADAVRQVDAAGDAPVIVVAAQGWHPGVIGIVAGRLRERYHRPACVVALEGETGRGSGRSVPGVDLGALVVEARHAGVLEAGGGHPMAAGFTVRADRVAELQTFLDRAMARRHASAPRPRLDLDGVLAPGGATWSTAEAVAALGPFGPGNPEPRFAIRDVCIAHAGEVGSGHVRCTAVGPDGTRLQGIAFRALDTALGAALLGGRDGAPLSLAGTLKAETWQGARRVQLRIEDAARAWPVPPP